jgi:predicted N-acetyltransferase YhbS
MAQVERCTQRSDRIGVRQMCQSAIRGSSRQNGIDHGRKGTRPDRIDQAQHVR